MASSGSTIVLNPDVLSQNVNGFFEDEEECVVPLKGGDDFRGGTGEGGEINEEGGDRNNALNSPGTGNMRRVPRTNSYYRRAGMTPQLDDVHFLANAPSFSTVATTATNVSDARLSSMASLANNSFANIRNGLSASAAMGMAESSNLHNDTRLALMNSHSAAGLGRATSRSTTSASSFPAGPTSNPSLTGGVARPVGTHNIFLQQDDADYQSLLTSVVTSNSIAMAPVATGQNSAPTAGTTTSVGSGPIELRRRQLSDEGTNNLSIESRNGTRSTGKIRRSSSSAVSILRRGRYSNNYLASVREDQDEGLNNVHNNNHNESFNSTCSNNVKFTAPTIHLIGKNQNVSTHQEAQHLGDKEQTVDNAEDFDDDEKIPADVLAAFSGGTFETDSPARARRSSSCSSLSSFPHNGDMFAKNDCKDYGDKKAAGKQRIPGEVTAVESCYKDDELDEYLFTGIQSLNLDNTAKTSSRRSSDLTSVRRCSSAEMMSSLSSCESKPLKCQANEDF